MRVWKLSGVLAGMMVLAMGVTVAAQRSEPGTTQPRQPRQAQPQAGSQQARNEVCPADISNLTVQASEMDNGGALVFTTTERNAQQLRTRLTRFVEMHEQVQQSQGMQQGSQGMQQGSQGMQQGSQGMQQPQQGMQQPQQRGSTGSQAQQQQRRFADMQALIHQGRAEMIQIPNGAVLLFSMENTAQVSQLQNELRQDAQALQQGRCPLALQIETGA